MKRKSWCRLKGIIINTIIFSVFGVVTYKVLKVVYFRGKVNYYVCVLGKQGGNIKMP